MRTERRLVALEATAASWHAAPRAALEGLSPDELRDRLVSRAVELYRRVAREGEPVAAAFDRVGLEVSRRTQVMVEAALAGVVLADE